MNNLNNETVGSIAAKDFRNALVFKKYGIDFCCGGKKTLNEACAQKNISTKEIEEAINLIDKNQGGQSFPFMEWSLDFLVDYIVNTHHHFVRSYLPEIVYYSNKVMKVHSQEHPELIRIQELVGLINNELGSHMMKEERILFPYIKELVLSVKNNSPSPASHFGNIENPIHLMEAEHEAAGGFLAEIRTLANDYSLPEGACGSYTLLYTMLDAFEQDLHVHIHLENNILFPKAITLEKNKLN